MQYVCFPNLGCFFQVTTLQGQQVLGDDTNNEAVIYGLLAQLA